MPLNRSRTLVWLLLSTATGLAAARPIAAGEAASETLLLQNPSVSATDVVFVHAQDLWIAPRGGGDARRLTSHVGNEATPRFRPTGSSSRSRASTRATPTST